MTHENETPKITYRTDGSVQCEVWYLNGKQHRVDGPAYIEYTPDGSVWYDGWYLNGERHRVDGPAEIGYYENGSVLYEGWRLNGGVHRVDGPAWVEYPRDGSMLRELWWLDNKQIDGVPERIRAISNRFPEMDEKDASILAVYDIPLDLVSKMVDADIKASVVKEALSAGLRYPTHLGLYAKGEVPLEWLLASEMR